MGYYDNSKAYKVWVLRTNTVLKVRDTIFDESNHIERVAIHATDNNDLPNLWTRNLNTTFSHTAKPLEQTDQETLRHQSGHHSNKRTLVTNPDLTLQSPHLHLIYATLTMRYTSQNMPQKISNAAPGSTLTIPYMDEGSEQRC